MSSSIQQAIDVLEEAKYHIDPTKWSEVVKNNFRREFNSKMEKAIQQLRNTDDQ